MRCKITKKCMFLVKFCLKPLKPLKTLLSSMKLSSVGRKSEIYKFFILVFKLFSHPPKRRRVTYAGGIRPASASVSTLCTSSMKPLHGIISYCTCILV